jgi:hypothetical protein
MIHKNFVDDDFPIADFFVDDDIYRDANGNLPDIKTCKSKWASPTDLYKWYKQAHADMVKIKDNCDRSGKHGFSLTGVFDVNDEQYQDFVQNFARGQKTICYLGALAMYRGTESFDWFTKTMPDNVPVVDGFEVDANNDQEQEEAGAPCVSSGKKSRAGSSRGPPDSIVITENDDAVDRLAAALHHRGESPERRKYYEARAKQIEVTTKHIELKNEEYSKTRDIRIMGSQAEETQKAVASMASIMSSLKDVSASKGELSNLCPGVKDELNSVESNIQKLLASLNQTMSRAANPRKRSRESMRQNGDNDESWESVEEAK